MSPAVCVTLVRQKRGTFQNVNFMAECIDAAKLKTFLIAKTGTPDPSYEKSFYGGPLLEKGQWYGASARIVTNSAGRNLAVEPLMTA